jgi:hypothetical protein
MQLFHSKTGHLEDKSFMLFRLKLLAVFNISVCNRY